MATASDTKRKLRKTKTWSQLLFPPEGEKAGGVLARAFPLLFGDAGHPWCGAVSVDVRRRGPSSDPFRSLDRHRSPVSALFEAFYRIGGNAAGFSYSFWQVMQSLLGFGGAASLGNVCIVVGAPSCRSGLARLQNTFPAWFRETPPRENFRAGPFHASKALFGPDAVSQ